ncbi:LysR substrate-binding domain-containing protein [Micromonospora sp. WMMD1102]|uniref:LysR substrate-binding domain-containing protein n=1 Tax=Micromonospora sp. WMMD1102 TaxID=3016105 RepID=UPI002414D7D8|nr:LysR substrate-binding domain-containing protein [Micromonospora sp. WMMD1102]MDG4789659.1 LysR substrate-binding domain-containing protein [Micromonospora sp. WMMD1102]
MAAHTGLRAGRVRLAAFPSALGTVVPVAAAGFAAAHPGVELRLVEAEPPTALRLLRAGEVDLALLFSHPDGPPDDTGLRRLPLLDEPIHLVTPAGTPAIPATGLDGYADRRWIAGCERCRTHLLRACAAAGFTPDVAFTTDDYVAVQALVAAGLGVTLLPGLALAAHRDPRVTTAPLPGHARSVYAALPGPPPDPPATAALLGQLRTACREASGHLFAPPQGSG